MEGGDRGGSRCHGGALVGDAVEGGDRGGALVEDVIVAGCRWLRCSFESPARSSRRLPHAARATCSARPKLSPSTAMARAGRLEVVVRPATYLKVEFVAITEEELEPRGRGQLKYELCSHSHKVVAGRGDAR